MVCIQENVGMFFAGLIVEEMRRLHFQNPLVRALLQGLLYDYLGNTERCHVFYAPKEDALAFSLPNASWGELEKKGEQLLLGIGFFPESFHPRGKRIVDISYYIGIEKMIAAKLGQWNERWHEVNIHFAPTVRTLNHVRSRISLDRMRIVHIAEDIDSIPAIRIA